MKDKNYLLRMCRYGGMKPTMRDKWRAFFRLYRIAVKKDDEHYSLCESNMDALRMFNPEWVAVLNQTGPCDGMPVFLRRRFLEMAQRKRSCPA